VTLPGRPDNMDDYPYGHVVVVGQWREGQGGRVPHAYLDAVKTAGGRAKLFSTFEPAAGEKLPDGFESVMGLDPDDASPMDDAIGLLLPGGGDIDPDWYGRPRHPRTHNVNNRRDRFEQTLMNEALRRDVPVFAICHGMQLLNVCLGGTLYQHLADSPQRVDHDCGYPSPAPVHRLRVKERNALAKYLGACQLEVNSHHHQGLDQVAGPLEEVAWAEDGVLEAVVSQAHSWVVGVQWHPEVMASTDPAQGRLFEAFIAAARNYSSGKTAKATA
jgi:putative glutamine amidotransferase